MDQETRERTRRSLHAIAEWVLAGPQYAQSGDIRLMVTPGGFGTVAEPDVRVEGTQVVSRTTGGRAIEGSCAVVAAALGLAPRALDDVYSDGSGVPLDEELAVDPAAAAEIIDGFARGDAAMRALAPGEEPVLWPEHFDVGIAVDEVNYGVSPGDASVPEPYAYVGPWQPRTGEFWNLPFGAARPLAELPDADAVEAFFRTGRERAAADPRA